MTSGKYFNKGVMALGGAPIGYVMKETDNRLLISDDDNNRYEIPQFEIQITERNLLIGLTLRQIIKKYKIKHDETLLLSTKKIPWTVQDMMIKCAYREKLKTAVAMITTAVLLMSASTIIITPTIIANSPSLQLAYAQGDLDLKTQNLSNNDGKSVEPLIVVDGRNVYVVWCDFTPGNFDIFFKRSTDGGKTFEKTQNLSNNDGESVEPQIVVDGRNVYVVWQDLTPGNIEIFFKRSTDGGKTFEK